MPLTNARKEFISRMERKFWDKMHRLHSGQSNDKDLGGFLGFYIDEDESDDDTSYTDEELAADNTRAGSNTLSVW